MAKVIKRKELALPVYEMNNGSVAEVVSWPPDNEFIGSVIQRRGDDIIIIGKSNYYPDFSTLTMLNLRSLLSDF